LYVPAFPGISKWEMQATCSNNHSFLGKYSCHIGTLTLIPELHNDNVFSAGYIQAQKWIYNWISRCSYTTNFGLDFRGQWELRKLSYSLQVFCFLRWKYRLALSLWGSYNVPCSYATVPTKFGNTKLSWYTIWARYT
jgi:hypothetical protein